MSFLTGSFAYGKPNPESDIDLVVLVTEEEARKLASLDTQEQDRPDYYGNTGTRSLRFGRLNLLVCTSEIHFAEWHQGTRLLKSIGPVDRPTAVAMFTKIFEEGLSQSAADQELGKNKQEETFKTYNSGCGLCGSAFCRGDCFK